MQLAATQPQLFELPDSRISRPLASLYEVEGQALRKEESCDPRTSNSIYRGDYRRSNRVTGEKSVPGEFRR